MFGVSRRELTGAILTHRAVVAVVSFVSVLVPFVCLAIVASFWRKGNHKSRESRSRSPSVLCTGFHRLSCDCRSFSTTDRNVNGDCPGCLNAKSILKKLLVDEQQDLVVFRIPVRPLLLGFQSHPAPTPSSHLARSERRRKRFREGFSFLPHRDLRLLCQRVRPRRS
jgi:hypothetical protein